MFAYRISELKKGFEKHERLHMTYMEWESTFELNIKEFDDHHKYLVDLMNVLHANIINGANNDTLIAVVAELIDYASYHFQVEEHWMEENKYPGFSQHRDEHIKFATKVSEFNKDFLDGKAALTIEVLSFLMDWLSDHILGADANLGYFAEGLSGDAR